MAARLLGPPAAPAARLRRRPPSPAPALPRPPRPGLSSARGCGRKVAAGLRREGGLVSACSRRRLFATGPGRRLCGLGRCIFLMDRGGCRTARPGRAWAVTLAAGVQSTHPSGKAASPEPPPRAQPCSCPCSCRAAFQGEVSTALPVRSGTELR